MLLLVAGSTEETYDTSHPISFLICVVVLFCFVGGTLGERISLRRHVHVGANARIKLGVSKKTFLFSLKKWAKFSWRPKKRY